MIVSMVSAVSFTCFVFMSLPREICTNRWDSASNAPLSASSADPNGDAVDVFVTFCTTGIRSAVAEDLATADGGIVVFRLDALGVTVRPVGCGAATFVALTKLAWGWGAVVVRDGVACWAINCPFSLFTYTVPHTTHSCNLINHIKF
jgi:hypothetical protein